SRPSRRRRDGAPAKSPAHPASRAPDPPRPGQPAWRAAIASGRRTGRPRRTWTDRTRRRCPSSAASSESACRHSSQPYLANRHRLARERITRPPDQHTAVAYHPHASTHTIRVQHATPSVFREERDEGEEGGVHGGDTVAHLVPFRYRTALRPLLCRDALPPRIWTKEDGRARR